MDFNIAVALNGGGSFDWIQLQFILETCSGQDDKKEIVDLSEKLAVIHSVSLLQEENCFLEVVIEFKYRYTTIDADSCSDNVIVFLNL